MSNIFGTILKVSTFGESHGSGIGAILEGCPAGVCLNLVDIQMQLDRRKPGQSVFCSSRKELDEVSILSGLSNGLTIGTPIGLFIKNKDYRSSEYKEITRIPRPSHGDYTYYAKYGLPPLHGGGRSSARETVARVATGAIAEKFLKSFYNIEIIAWVSSIGDITTLSVDHNSVSILDVEKNQIRCPDDNVALKMKKLISDVRDANDSIGGIITCLCRNVPAGWGEPVFDKLEAKLAHAMLSIPATKGFEIGSGFSCASMRGSLHNDSFKKHGQKIRLKTNNSGGVQGGISTGDNIIFKVAFKPTASIGLSQETVDFEGNSVVLNIKGRHDPCVVPRAVPIIEAMAALVLGDLALMNSISRVENISNL